MDRRQPVASERSEQARARILLIEDEPAVARLTELVLTNAGHSVDVTAEHSSVSRLVAEQHYDLIIADTELGPRTVGLRGLEPLTAAAPCPVLLFSAHRFNAADIRAAGFAGFIGKPFDIDELLSLVKSKLAQAAEASATD